MARGKACYDRCNVLRKNEFGSPGAIENEQELVLRVGNCDPLQRLKREPSDAFKPVLLQQPAVDSDDHCAKVTIIPGAYPTPLTDTQIKFYALKINHLTQALLLGYTNNVAEKS